MKLSNNPQNINNHVWYYERKRGIELMIHPEPAKYIQIRIPWSKLLKSVKRYRAVADGK